MQEDIVRHEKSRETARVSPTYKRVMLEDDIGETLAVSLRFFSYFVFLGEVGVDVGVPL